MEFAIVMFILIGFAYQLGRDKPKRPNQRPFHKSNIILHTTKSSHIMGRYVKEKKRS